MDGVSGAASVIAVVDLSAKVASLCFQYYTAVKNAKADIEQLQEEINRLEITLKHTQRLLESPNGVRLQTSERLADGLPGCCIQLKDLETKLETKLKPKTTQRLRRFLGGHALVWPFQSKDVEKIIQNLNKFRDSLSTALTIDQTIILLGDERIKILEWISPVPNGKHHNTVKDARTSGTCEWLLLDKRFHEWENTSSSMILWLQGSPGTGKTFLTSKVIDHVQHSFEKSQHDEGFAFFYCNRNEEERRKPLIVLRSFVRQLLAGARFPTEILKKVQKIWSEKRLGASDLSLTDCREQLLESVSLYTRTTLVLDALDECEPESRAELVKTIEILLAQSKQPLRVFISSRPDRDIRDKFLSRPNIEIETKHNEKDIQRFVNEEIIKHGNWIDMSPLLKEEIIKTLLERSQGMFQWVFLQIKQILDLETEVAIRDRLGRLPTSLKSAYEEIYNKVQARHKLDRSLADRALIWVMGARYPLESETLLSAIRLDTDSDTFDLSEKISESQLLHLCNNLLVLDSQQNVWRFSHLSAREYFEENHCGLYEAHSHIAKVCLKILLETHKKSKDGSNSTDRETNHDTGTFGFFERLHPLQNYSRHYWIAHVQTQCHDADIALVRLLKRFLGSFSEGSVQYQTWNRALHSDMRMRPSSVFLPKTVRQITAGNAAIFVACRFSIYTLLADWWADAKIPLSLKNNDGNNLLELAALTGCRPICEVLVKRGMDANVQNRTYGTVLIAAAANGHIEVVKFLVRECGVDATIVIPGRIYGSALSAAVREGHINIVKCLIQEARTDPNMLLPNRFEGNALAVAVAFNRIDIFKFLVQEGGADPNTVHQRGRYGSALAAAAAQDRIDIVKFLVQKGGADPNTVLQTGKHGSALAAAIDRHNIDIVKFLIQEGGTNPNMPLQIGGYDTAAALAKDRKYTEIIELLAEEGKTDLSMTR